MILDSKIDTKKSAVPSIFSIRLVQSTVKEIRQLTNETFILVADRNRMKFQAGQRVRIGLKNDDHKRKYSIYSGMEEENLEFLIREVPEGYLTPKLKPMKVGDEIEILGPNGDFTLNKSEWPGSTYLFISTGTGIAPFHSMVQSFPVLKYKLLHGISYFDEAYNKEQYDRTKQVVCTSRDTKGDFHGRVTDYLRTQTLEKYDQVYICGNNEMIKESMIILKEQGYSDEQLHTEVYF